MGAWTASALVILPPTRVIRTWTGPYWVRSAFPVTVRACPAAEPAVPEAPEPPEGAAVLILSSADWSDFLYPALV